MVIPAVRKQISSEIISFNSKKKQKSDELTISIKVIDNIIISNILMNIIKLYNK